MNNKINVILGLDISTSCIGVCIINAETNKIEKMFPIKLTSKRLENFFSKVDWAVDIIKKEIDIHQYNIIDIFIEEAAKKFTSGFSSAGTLFTLARFNGIISNEVRKLFGTEPVMINVRSARKILNIKIDQKDKSKDTKEKVFEIVKTLLPTFPWITHIAKSGKQKGKIVFDKENQDMADAWVVANGGMLLS